MYLGQANTTLTIASGFLIHGAYGLVGGTVSGGAVINNGIIDADASGSGIAINPAAFTNGSTGVVEATNSGSLTVSAATMSNFSGGTLTGGAWEAAGGGTLRVILPAALTTNAATLVLDGANSKFYSTTGTTNALAGLTSNVAGASLTIQNGYNFTPPSNFANAGALTVGSASSFLAWPTPQLTAKRPGPRSCKPAAWDCQPHPFPLACRSMGPVTLCKCLPARAWIAKP